MDKENRKTKTIWVTKTSGVRERFSLTKLRRSLIRSGADRKTSEMVVSRIAPEVRDGMKTLDIYKQAFSILRKNKFQVAIRYSLRKAVLELGPSGFPFEKYIAEVLRRKGYAARTGVVLPGACVQHEVDILLEKENKHIFVECKFHNQQGVKSDVKIALYVHARFLDLQKGHAAKEKATGKDTPKIYEGWLVTNTKLTLDAVQYAQCAGLRVISWDYPEKGNLQDLILETGVHPLTFLSTLSAKDKAELLARGVVMCRDLKKNPFHLRSIGLSDDQVKKVVAEVDLVCQEF
jgi:hypothetical protein